MTEPVICSTEPIGTDVVGLMTIIVDRPSPIPAYASEASVVVELTADESISVHYMSIRFPPRTDVHVSHPNGEATATKSGATYSIAGRAMDTSPPVDDRPLKEFQIDVTCP